jgi:hypothetical protein
MAEFLEFMEDWTGYQGVKPKLNEMALARTIDLIVNKERLSPIQHAAKMEEAITTSDFPYLLGTVMDRQLLANYRAMEDPLYAWKDYMKIGSVADFRTVSKEKLVGKDPLLPEVPEKGEYQPFKPVNCRYEYSVKKYGKQFDVSYESIVNDVLGAFNDIPAEMANGAKDTEAHFATSLIASATAPNPLLYGDTITDCGQEVTNLGALPLTIANLEATIALMKAQTAPVTGKILRVRPRYLVVPPQLEMTARAILTSAFKTYIPDSTAAASVPMPTANVVPQAGIQLRVNEWLPYIDTTAGDSTWYLFAEPSRGAAVEVGYLRGHETPEVVMKASDKTSVGGGLTSPFSGDFATDNIFYRVRDVVGGTQMDPRMTYAQVG